MTLIASIALVATLAFGTGATDAPRLPDGASVASLAVPVTRRVEALIDGRDWSCEADLCTAGHQDTADSMPLWMECGDAASELGAFTAYRTGRDSLEPAKLARCNAQAKVIPRN